MNIREKEIKMIKIINISLMLSFIALSYAYAAEGVEGPKDEAMHARSVYQRPEGSEECLIDKHGCSSPCSEGCKESVESLNSVFNGGPTVGRIEEKDPCCALTYGVTCFPINFIWRACTFPWQASLDCCDRNRALYKLIRMDGVSEVKTGRFTIKKFINPGDVPVYLN